MKMKKLMKKFEKLITKKGIDGELIIIAKQKDSARLQSFRVIGKGVEPNELISEIFERI